MTQFRDSKCIWLAGASMLAMGLLAPAAIAQEDESPRTLSTVTVTTQKVEESIQDVPIAVSAFDEDALKRLQLTGGPDLVKSIPNVSFTKGQFTGSNFKIRGIGADVVAQSGDAGVGVHQNDVPLQVNRLFEAEFYDIERVEVLRGPQGTLYGRNATGGVVNVITAKPVMSEFQADASFTYGNHSAIKAKGMVNLPIGDRLALRVAGTTTSRDGYVTNSVTGRDIDDRDLWSMRATLGFEPTDNFRGWFSYEHFEEDDSRLRAGKQLCKKSPVLESFAGIPLAFEDQVYTSQGCQEAPLSDSYERTNSISTLAGGLGIAVGLLNGDVFTGPLTHDLRTIEAAIEPQYQADQDLYTLNLEYDINDSLRFTSLTSYNENTLVSVEDASKFTPNIAFNDLSAIPPGVSPAADLYNALFPGGVVNDPQLGPSNLFNVSDLSGGSSETWTQEFRLQSDFDGRFNFNLGAIYMDSESIDPNRATDGYYVLSNTLSALVQFHNALYEATGTGALPGVNAPISLDTSNVDGDSNILNSLDGTGRNYFRSLSPFKLKSTAVFGEGYYDISDDLKLTVGLRYTDDEKEQLNIPTYLFTPDILRPDPLAPVPNAGTEQSLDGNVDGNFKVDFQEVTGRIGLDWSP
ncbi:MAG: TonB-dependent receptor plug domain-containing protein, partial [Hyphomonas sp.]